MVGLSGLICKLADIALINTAACVVTGKVTAEGDRISADVADGVGIRPHSGCSGHTASTTQADSCPHH